MHLILVQYLTGKLIESAGVEMKSSDWFKHSTLKVIGDEEEILTKPIKIQNN